MRVHLYCYLTEFSILVFLMNRSFFRGYIQKTIRFNVIELLVIVIFGETYQLLQRGLTFKYNYSTLETREIELFSFSLLVFEFTRTLVNLKYYKHT